MNIQKTQSGFAHVIIVTVILAVALVGSIGYIVWNNFSNNQNVVTTPNSDSNPDGDEATDTGTKPAVTYKTFTDSTYNISFQYPSNWTVGEPKFTQADMPYWNRTIDVLDENGEIAATLVLGVYGLGGTCSGQQGPTFTVIDTAASSVPAQAKVALTFVLAPTSGGYNGYYGLQSSHTALGDFDGCLFYQIFMSNLKVDGQDMHISFGNSVVTGDRYGMKFSTSDNANTFVQSDKYKAIKKMILSLTY